MRIVVAPDSFKECATAREVAEAIRAGVHRVLPDAEVDLAPMADGGEGTVDALIAATGGHAVDVVVSDPLGRPVSARYGVLGDGATAVIEMASASGLDLVEPDRRNPWIATTRGTGELLCDALDRGFGKIIIGIGGSATNDGGAGMAQALGFSLRDENGAEIGPGGGTLAALATIDSAGKHESLDRCEVLVACDVDNPLCGPVGASRVYGPQKGATGEMVEGLDEALRRLGTVIEAQLGVHVMDLPGAGAAGGLGAGLVAFTGAELRPGVSLVAEACGLAGRLEGADLVITGEGRMDGQTAYGKTPAGVARLAQERGVPVVALAGALGDGYEHVYETGVSAAFAISPGPVPLEDALANVKDYLARAAASAVRLFVCGRRRDL